MIDGRAGDDHDDMGDAAWWAHYVQRIQQAADNYSDARSPDDQVSL